MNELQIFDYGQKSIRTVDVDGNPWFSGKDVAEALGYSDTDDAIRRHCKLLKLFKPGETPGLECGPRGMVFIPEPDVYRLAAKSTLPSAEKFEAWIFEEVIPSIRKTGSYGMDPMKALNDPAAMRGLLLTYCEKVLALEETVNQQRPKVIALDRLSTANGSMCITDAAKTLQIQPKILFQWMSASGWIYKRAGGSGSWIAYQNRIQQGVLEHKTTTVTRGDGSEKTTFQVLVTPKGLAVLAEKLSIEENIFA